ncbi:flagellar biosynthetic protein FliO [Pseudoalteromonas sp. T1lg65]|uniref:flagellar biosynthetic protein FliO n=1 Tax=Pseudoalteromonas sp. T1lg65 TaxID=2077101 RepID=UPI003F7A76B2
MVSMILSLGLVVLLIFGLAYLVKRMNPNLVSQKDFKVIRSLALGPKERLLVVEIDDRQHLLGVTPGSINYLYQLETPLDNTPVTPFASELQKFLSGRVNSDKQNKKHQHD